MFNPAQVKKQEEIESKRQINKLLLPILLLAWFFIFGWTARAAPVYDINWPGAGTGGSNFGRSYIFQKFIPSASSISGIELYFNSSLAVINLCQGALDTGALLNNHACANGILIASTTCSTNSSPFWDSEFSDCPFSNTHALVTGADYYYEIIGATTQASGNYDYTYPGQTCGVQADGSSPYCFPRNHYNGYMDRNNLRTYSLPPVAPVIDPVIIVPGIMGSWKVSGQWELDPILHTYDNLWQALKNAGYEQGKTLFAFPYEWRQDNTLTAYQLKQKIDEVKSVCDCNKVDVVVHSMGGLIARAYAESDYYGNDIDQLVFLGTPHKGSPKNYLKWEGAKGFISQQEKLAKLYFSQEAKARGYDSLFDYIQNYVKSVEQLLPDYAYLQNSGDTGFRVYDKINYPNNYPYNTFLENINSADKINQFASSGIKIMNFIGDTGDNTINAIKVSSGEEYWPMWQHGYADESIRLAGDGTVPEVSSSLFMSTKIDNAEHSALPTKAQKQVIQYLTGNLPTIEITDVKEPKKLLMIRIFSPADFVITAPDDKRLGKDFTNNTAINEIPGAFYSGFNADAEFAVIPDPQDGEYKVELHGTGQGEYKLSASLIDDNQQIDQEFSGQIMPAQQRDFNITYLAQAENPLSDLEPIDIVPPVIIINKPTESEQYLHSDNLAIDYTATDDFSGLATTSITIDGQIIATTTIDLFDYVLGTHNLTITAIDKAGNQAQAQAKFEIIANIDSTISDIQEIYNRAWLTDKSYQALLKKAFKLLKLQAKYFEKEQKLIDKLREKTQDDSKLTDKQKQKLIERYNKKLAELKRNRQKAINKSLNLIIKLLDKAKDKNQINQQGYDIILSDVNYLRENL